MKRLTFALLLSAVALTASAQKSRHAVGAHLGAATIDLEYQYHPSSRNFVDVTAGTFGPGDGFVAQGVYNWNLKRWDNWTPGFATWKVWGGVGAGMGYYDAGHREGMLIGPVGTVGFGFTTKRAPVTVGVDYRPMASFVAGDDGGFVRHGLKNVGVTVTYRF